MTGATAAAAGTYAMLTFNYVGGGSNIVTLGTNYAYGAPWYIYYGNITANGAPCSIPSPASFGFGNGASAAGTWKCMSGTAAA